MSLLDRRQWKCDRCKKEALTATNAVPFLWRSLIRCESTESAPEEKGRRHVCEDCMTEFNAFMAGRPVQMPQPDPEPLVEETPADPGTATADAYDLGAELAASRGES